MEKIQIRQASIDDLKIMTQWAADEQWNPGKKDASAFVLTDPNGFFVATLANEIIACISNVIYSKQFSFLGFYIVKPSHRGKGYGFQLWQHAMKYTKDCNIALDGVIAQQDNYRKSGFSLAHRNIRFCLEKNPIDFFAHPHLLPACTIPFPAILKYHKPFFPAERNAFVMQWLLQYGGLAYYDQGIKGYGVIRPAQHGFRIGPLFADNPKIAAILVQGLCATVPKNQSIYLDIPETNHDALVLTKVFQMKSVFETARMYTKAIPQIQLEKTFGITTFEVG